MSTAQLSDQQVRDLGVKLKSSRESQRRDIADAAFRIALSPSQLRALEAGDRRPFYSTNYFLQAVERYASFLGVTLPELASYRAQTSPSSVRDANPGSSDPPQPDGDAFKDALGQSGKARAVSAPMPTAPLPQSLDAAPKRSPQLARLVMIGAAVIALAAVVSLQDNTSPPASKKVAEPMAAAEPATPSTTVTTTAATTEAAPTTATATPAPEQDGRIQSSINGWVQIVSKSGEKSNLRIAAGENIDFIADETAAVVIGRPEKATLTVRGKTIDLRQHTVDKEGSPRALVIIGDILR